MANTSELQFATRAERVFAALDRLQVEGSVVGSPLRSDRDKLVSRPWEFWNDIPCVVLLGEPGSGKTCEFLRHVQELQQVGEPAFLSRWQDWCDGDDIFDTLDNRKGFFSAIETGQSVWWFVDALDEGRIKTEAAFDILRKGLRQLHGDGRLHLIKIRMSCRSRDWRLSDEGLLSGLFGAFDRGGSGTGSVATLQLLPLQESAIRVLAMEKLREERAVDRFMDALKRRHVSALAGHPLALAMMLSLYLEDDSSLDYDRTTLYDRAIERLATEHNRERADRKPPKTLPGERIAVARRLAVRVVLGGNGTIGVPDSDARGDRVVDASRTGAKRFELFETLDTGLFTQHAHGTFVFAHRSFAEYLAARDLSERIVHLPLSHIVPLFPVEHGVIPAPLRETASWLAGLSGAFRRWLIERDPLTAAQGDTIRYTSEERETLLMSLADRFVDRNWQREFDRFGDLARSVPDEVLRRLLHRERSMAVRQMTIEMIDVAEVTSLFPDLLSIVLGHDEVPGLRADATGVLAKHSVGNLAAVCSPLLQLPPDQDPQDDIAGILAHYLYPDYLTTDQLLQSLRVPRRPRMLSHYRWFWEHLFLQRLPGTRNERRTSLDAMLTLLTDDSDFIQLQPFAKIVMSLLVSVLQEGGEDIDCLGPWLVRMNEWIRHHGVPDESLHAQLISALKEYHGLCNSLLRWRLSNWSDEQEFHPWQHVPFYEVLFDGKNAESWIELSREYADRPVLGRSLFDEVIALAFRYPIDVPMETVEALSTLVPAHGKRWDSARVSDLDGSFARVNREQREHKAENENRNANSISQVRSNIDLLRSGRVYPLMWVLDSVSLDCFGLVPTTALVEKYGYEVARAVRDGVIRSWMNFSDSSELWPRSNNLPGQAIIAGIGFRELYPSNENLPEFNEQQVQYLIWRVLQNESDTPALLLVLWDRYRDDLWKRLDQTLLAESQQPDGEYPTTWRRMASVDPRPANLTVRLIDHLIAHRMPHHARARQYALKMLFSLEFPEVNDLIRSTIEGEWCSNSLPAPWAEPSAVATLSAWWLRAPKDAIVFLREKIFHGHRYRPRTVSFVNALQDLQGRSFAFSVRWDDSVSWDDYAELLPLLYDRPPQDGDNAISGWVTPVDEFLRARDGLVVHLANAPVQQAYEWFAQWKRDPRFGYHRDWFATLHAEIEQRRADESWAPLECAVLEAVLAGDSLLVRYDDDAAALLNEMIASELVPTFRSDHSLVPLLWEGTKSAGDRKPRDEKALQTAIYGQLMLLLARHPVAGAREPEVFDAKKPDARISYFLDSGLRIDIPIEIKWAWHSEVWDAPGGQVLTKYMQDPRIRHAVYIVGWAGRLCVKTGPNGEDPLSPIEFECQLQEVTNARLAGTGKSISVHVVDASVLD
ncbi:NACHT domain-containing protein [Burkholderia anthina]|uniref:NACHT domain-containing protein n=1 Tax=Burkholderia anthina TaxID=179879 RepID=UPI00158BF2DB|nr:hypothetical protein [Burkholderia anthina]